MTNLINPQWRLAARPDGLVKNSDFEWIEEPVPELKAGDILIRNIYLSIDPAARGWMRAERTYVSPIKIGNVMRGIGLGVVETSNNPKFQEGDLVTGLLGWQHYLVSDGSGWISKIPAYENIPMAALLNVFGMIGLTAYFGLLDIGKPKEGETLVVSAAAGAVGSLVGQIGKIKGCKVIGIAGTDKKCQWITEDLDFDSAINYKTEHVRHRLRELCPSGIDIYFDNVGGTILDSALGNLNKYARVVLCGFISQYNESRPTFNFSYFGNILFKRASISGFIVSDYFDRTMEALADLVSWYTEGKIQSREEIIKGLENAPQALRKLFDGSNRGKLIVKISEEPAESNDH